MSRFMLRSLCAATLLAFGAQANAAMINEFAPNPTGTDPSANEVELIGTPGDTFSGWLIAVEDDGNNGAVNGSAGNPDIDAVSGTFDSNGLLVVTISDFENPSFTLILTDSFTGAFGSTDIDSDNDGTVDDLSDFGTILDAVGIADDGSEALYAGQLGGTDLFYSGDEPKLVFRDSLDPSTFYSINDPAGSDAISGVDGSPVPFTAFNIDPEASTFGSINPTAVPEPGTAVLALLASVAAGAVRMRRVLG